MHGTVCSMESSDDSTQHLREEDLTVLRVEIPFLRPPHDSTLSMGYYPRAHGESSPFHTHKATASFENQNIYLVSQVKIVAIDRGDSRHWHIYVQRAPT